MGEFRELNQEPVAKNEEGHLKILNRGREISRPFLEKISELKEKNRILRKKIKNYWGSPYDNEKELEENEQVIEKLTKEQQEVEDKIKEELKEYFKKSK